MIDRKSFDKLRKEYEDLDEARENIIRKSRDVIKLSKNIIYSVHRKDLSTAKKGVEDIKKEVKTLSVIATKNSSLYVGSYNCAIQEYVEAVCYYDFATANKLTTPDKLGVGMEDYLLGCCDLIGELVRNAINSSINGDHKQAFKIKEFVDEFYNELMKFDFRNSELRKKFDGVKWELKKIDDAVFKLSLEGKRWKKT